jgi:hypothetical protein
MSVRFGIGRADHTTAIRDFFTAPVPASVSSVISVVETLLTTETQRTGRNQRIRT